MSVREPRHSHQAFIPEHALEQLIEERRRLGIDDRDEVWEEVYHMTPPASSEHANVESDFTRFLGDIVARHDLGRLARYGVREPGTGDKNYRIPDLSFVSKARAAIISAWGCEGGPDVIFEVRSPGDDSYLKLPFYAARGCIEAIVIDRDTRRVELFRAVEQAMAPVSAGLDGWLVSEPLGVAFRRTERDGKPALEVRDTRDPARSTLI